MICEILNCNHLGSVVCIRKISSQHNCLPLSRLELQFALVEDVDAVAFVVGPNEFIGVSVGVITETSWFNDAVLAVSSQKQKLPI